MITFFVMTFLAAFMLFICLNLLTGTFRLCNFNKEAINGADCLILKAKDQVSDFKIKEIAQGSPLVCAYEENKYLDISGKYRKKGAKSWADYTFVLESYEEDRNIQTASIDISRFSGNDIVLPVSLSTNYQIGDRFEFKVGNNIYEFRVAGFNEDYIYSSPMNMSCYLCYVSEKMYQEIEFENAGFAIPSTLAKMQYYDSELKKMKISSDEASDLLMNEYNLWLQNYQSSHPEYTVSVNVNWIPCDMMMIAGMILPFMFTAIMLVFALIIFIIALVVIDFSVKNFIIDNMKNTGIMEAGGYTVKEMMLILLVQLLTVSFAGSFLGALVAALVQGKLGFIMLYLIGLTWNQKADLMVFTGVVAGICFIMTTAW